MEHLEHDWEQQREQLSALLDNELDEQERAELETHLPTCVECRAELESLRRTKALVRALPQPALPRSFALPLEAASLPEQRLETAAARPTPRSAQPTARRDVSEEDELDVPRCARCNGSAPLLPCWASCCYSPTSSPTSRSATEQSTGAPQATLSGSGHWSVFRHQPPRPHRQNAHPVPRSQV